MSKKIKYRPNIHQPSLFDSQTSPFRIPGLEPETPEAHPSIRDFVVEVKKRQQASSGTASNMELDTASLRPAAALSFISFGSGSSGNCAYIGDSEGGILIDAGVDPDKVKTALRQNGLSMDQVNGICLTHDHSDHVRYVYSLVRKYKHIGVYCTPRVLQGLLRRHSISRRIKDYHRPIYKEFPFKVGNFEITPFEVSHDGSDNAGFFITCGDHRFAVATDLGCITDRVEHYMRQAQHIMIESNYDAQMLRTGPYPMYLKARIAADTGHLDNTVTASFVASLASGPLRNVFLCHLSHDNNLPAIATQCVRTALLQAGIGAVGDASGSLQARGCRVQLMALPRFDATPLMKLRLD
ncbi:MAG TPA: MBL fold metallo-hydrolase [Porphyromonadaceae bacterium]|nr:MBL fold metallo-hydrolase [Paramuribaculum sp.]HAB40848.1 MBL fold metallo-hydrolase [Porphyromonadaceae bacterium]